MIEVARQLGPDENLLIVIDQFEEIFRYKDIEPVTAEGRSRVLEAGTEAQEFVQLLLAPAAISPRVRCDYHALRLSGRLRRLP